MDFDVFRRFDLIDVGSIQMLDTIGTNHMDIRSILIRFRIKMPLCLAREWWKYGQGVQRTALETPVDVWVPGEIRFAPQYVQDIYKWSTASALYAYNSLLASGVSEDTASSILPQNVFVEFIESGPLISYEFLNRIMREAHANKELFLFAQTMSDLIRTQFLHSWDKV